MNRFKQGSGVYTCQGCGKKTRETGAGESNVDLCLGCFNDAGDENEHLDGHTEPVKGCRFCEAAS